MPNLWDRLKNAWAWSALDPKVIFASKHFVPPEIQHIFEELQSRPSPIGAEIIYPDKQKEILQVKPDASLDELLG